MNRGKYIVLEGPEGVGKTTQLMELNRRLSAAGLPVRSLREPDSQSDLTARAIRNLTQDPSYPMNTRTEVLLYNAARSQSLEVIQKSVEQGVICLVDRNYLTTLAIQYYGRGDVPDYQKITAIIEFAVGSIEPDLCIVLDAPVMMLRERLKGRYSGERFDNLDEAFLERVRAGYLWEAKQRQLPVIFATESTEKVADNIWQLVSQNLAVRKPTAQATAVDQPIQSIKEIIKAKSELPPTVEPPLNNQTVVSEKNSLTPKDIVPQSQQTTKVSLVTKDSGGHYRPTADGLEYLRKAVTNPTANVYAFTDKLSPVTIAAAMARLSRRSDDMRITILDEFAQNIDTDNKLIRRVITAYGDDSVQQLAGLHMVVENASNLLTKKLEWGRLAAYLEQSTRYIYFDHKDSKGHYQYYVPEELKPDVRDVYNSTLNSIFDNYSTMVRKLTDHIRNTSKLPASERDGAWQAATRAQACDAVRPVLPVATKSTVGLFASGQALESLIMHLLSDNLLEARTTGQALLVEARKVMPSFLERADQPERGGALIAYRSNTKNAIKALSNQYLETNHGRNEIDDAVTLSDYWPRNEMDLVADMLYEHSSMSLKTIRKSVESLAYDQKLNILQTYMGERLNRRQRPGRALEKAHYSWDIMCDYGIFRDLQRHRLVDDLAWQALTPRYGYEIPSLIEQTGLSDLFEDCFQRSLKLYSMLQENGYQQEAQYATLLGHKMRWKITYNARQAFHIHELRTSPQGHPGYRKLVLEMHEKLASVHPNLAAGMKFVNQGEDPELSRLAAERYTQFKLKNFS